MDVFMVPPLAALSRSSSCLLLVPHYDNVLNEIQSALDLNSINPQCERVKGEVRFHGEIRQK